MAYVKGAEFINYIERMVRFSTDMQEVLKAGIKEHVCGWQMRADCYQAVDSETGQMQRNLSLVLYYRDPKLIEAPKATKLPIRKKRAIGA
jgi:hypothetical protein